MSLLKKGFLSAAVAVACIPSLAQAGVFNIPHFVEPGNFALGLEPEVVLSPSAGVGFNAKYTQGISDLMNGQFILGTGSGPRRFRIGGNLTFDFVPDVDSQPGIGISTQALYYRVPDAGRMELTGIPYIHKSFAQGDSQAVDPFLAVPIGIAFSDGTYQSISTLAIGALFQRSEHLSFSSELGINLNHAETYFSGGIIFNH